MSETCSKCGAKIPTRVPDRGNAAMARRDSAGGAAGWQPRRHSAEPAPLSAAEPGSPQHLPQRQISVASLQSCNSSPLLHSAASGSGFTSSPTAIHGSAASPSTTLPQADSFVDLCGSPSSGNTAQQQLPPSPSAAAGPTPAGLSSPGSEKQQQQQQQQEDPRQTPTPQPPRGSGGSGVSGSSDAPLPSPSRRASASSGAGGGGGGGGAGLSLSLSGSHHHPNHPSHLGDAAPPGRTSRSHSLSFTRSSSSSGSGGLTASPAVGNSPGGVGYKLLQDSQFKWVYSGILLGRHLSMVRNGEKEMQGAVCIGCYDLLLEEPEARVWQLNSERGAIESCLEEYASGPSTFADDPSDAEIEGLEDEIAALQDELESLYDEADSSAQEAAAMQKELRELELGLDVAERLAAAEAYQREESERETQQQKAQSYTMLRREILGLSQASGLFFMFHIEATRVPGKINGHRFEVPECTAIPQDRGSPAEGCGSEKWNELNCALGHLVLLVKTLQNSVQGPSKIHFVLEASNSQVIDPSGAYHKLFSQAGSSTTSVDEALGYLGKSVRHIAAGLKVKLPKELHQRDLWLAEGGNTDWGKNILTLLQQVQLLMAVVEWRQELSKLRSRASECAPALLTCLFIIAGGSGAATVNSHPLKLPTSVASAMPGEVDAELVAGDDMTCMGLSQLSVFLQTLMDRSTSHTPGVSFELSSCGRHAIAVVEAEPEPESGGVTPPAQRHAFRIRGADFSELNGALAALVTAALSLTQAGGGSLSVRHEDLALPPQDAGKWVRAVSTFALHMHWILGTITGPHSASQGGKVSPRP